MKREMRTFSNDTVLVKERREHIRKCATALFVKIPFEKANMEQVLEACDMSKGALYHYVGSKRDILSLILEHIAHLNEEHDKALKRETAKLSPTDAIREIIKSRCQRIDETQDEFILLDREIATLSKDEREPYLDNARGGMTFIENTLERGVEAGEFEIDDIKLAAANIVLSTRGWATWRWELRKHYTVEEYAKSLTEFILKAIKAPAKSAIEVEVGR